MADKELKTYTISIYSENNVGLLNRISSIFLKRHFNIESLTTSQSEIKDVFRFVIVVNIDDKVKSSSLFEERHIQNIIKESHANIVTVSPEFFVIEKTGFRNETDRLHQDLAPFGLLQFVRSGRISVTKSKMEITELLSKFKKDN